MKKILMVLEAEFPPDERVEKEIKSLNQEGYEISIAVYTRQNRKPVEKLQHCTIYRVKLSDILYKSSAAILLQPFYFNFWFKFLDGILAGNEYSAIHIHDLPLAKVGYILAKKHQIKLVCDQHEFYSNWIVRTRHYNTFSGKIIRFFSNWKKYENYYLNRADLVITVEEPLRKIYINQVGVLPEKIITVPNTPSAGTFDIELTDQSVTEKYKGKFVLFYAGGLDHLRGIDFILESLSVIRNEIRNVLFVVAGKESRAFNMKEHIDKFGVGDVTDFLGWVPLKSLSSYIAASNICLFVPKADNMEINNTIATKIYQYAAMGKPVIVSEASKMKEFVQSNEIGFSVHWGNVEELNSVIKMIRDDPSISESIKGKAVQVAARYTWENTSKNLIQHYHQLIP